LGSLTHVIAPHMIGYLQPKNFLPLSKNLSISMVRVSFLPACVLADIYKILFTYDL
jgi:hypothetical protein